ncbi:MAG: hypothetical protein V4591_07625, partial [Bdellovibrionota bacterium]
MSNSIPTIPQYRLHTRELYSPSIESEQEKQSLFHQHSAAQAALDVKAHLLTSTLSANGSQILNSIRLVPEVLPLQPSSDQRTPEFPEPEVKLAPMAVNKVLEEPILRPPQLNPKTLELLRTFAASQPIDLKKVPDTGKATKTIEEQKVELLSLAQNKKQFIDLIENLPRNSVDVLYLLQDMESLLQNKLPIPADLVDTLNLSHIRGLLTYIQDRSLLTHDIVLSNRFRKDERPKLESKLQRIIERCIIASESKDILDTDALRTAFQLYFDPLLNPMHEVKQILEYLFDGSFERKTNLCLLEQIFRDHWHTENGDELQKKKADRMVQSIAVLAQFLNHQGLLFQGGGAVTLLLKKPPNLYLSFIEPVERFYSTDPGSTQLRRKTPDELTDCLAQCLTNQQYILNALAGMEVNPSILFGAPKGSLEIARNNGFTNTSSTDKAISEALFAKNSMADVATQAGANAFFLLFAGFFTAQSRENARTPTEVLEKRIKIERFLFETWQKQVLPEQQNSYFLGKNNAANLRVTTDFLKKTGSRKKEDKTSAEGTASAKKPLFILQIHGTEKVKGFLQTCGSNPLTGLDSFLAELKTHFADGEQKEAEFSQFLLFMPIDYKGKRLSFFQHLESFCEEEQYSSFIHKARCKTWAFWTTNGLSKNPNRYRSQAARVHSKHAASEEQTPLLAENKKDLLAQLGQLKETYIKNMHNANVSQQKQVVSSDRVADFNKMRTCPHLEAEILFKKLLKACASGKTEACQAFIALDELFQNNNLTKNQKINFYKRWVQHLKQGKNGLGVLHPVCIRRWSFLKEVIAAVIGYEVGLNLKRDICLGEMATHGHMSGNTTLPGSPPVDMLVGNAIGWGIGLPSIPLFFQYTSAGKTTASESMESICSKRIHALENLPYVEEENDIISTIWESAKTLSEKEPRKASFTDLSSLQKKLDEIDNKEALKCLLEDSHAGHETPLLVLLLEKLNPKDAAYVRQKWYFDEAKTKKSVQSHFQQLARIIPDFDAFYSQVSVEEKLQILLDDAREQKTGWEQAFACIRAQAFVEHCFSDTSKANLTPAKKQECLKMLAQFIANADKPGNVGNPLCKRGLNEALLVKLPIRAVGGVVWAISSSLGYAPVV